LNKSLLAFAIVLIVGGVIIGISLLILLGVFLLIPGLLTTPKTQSKIPVSKKEPPPPPRRISPPSAPQAPAAPAAPAPEYLQSSPAQPPATAPMTSYDFSKVSASSTQGFTPALFPAAIFPPMSGQTNYRTPQVEPRERQQNQNDELLELGLLIAVLRLTSG
jgi:hypothetical protein